MTTTTTTVRKSGNKNIESNPSNAATEADKSAKAPNKLPTHELFDVQEREGQKPFWNKVGAAFVNKDNSHTVLLYQPGRAEKRSLQLRVIDREEFPVRSGTDPKKAPTHQLFEVTPAASEDEKATWKNVGAAFTNKDGSLSVIVDEGQREGPKSRFQMRIRKDKPNTGATAA